MTTVQVLGPLLERMWHAVRVRPGGGVLASAVGVAVACVLGACASHRDPLTPPQVLVSPYGSAGADVLWAVAPMVNESGASFVDELGMSDVVVGKVTEVRGLAAVPMNRTVAAMRTLGLDRIDSPADARALAGALGVDGVLVGTITAYDPYTPPKLGLSLALYRTNASQAAPMRDPSRIQGAYTDGQIIDDPFDSRPASAVVVHLDGENHQVQMDVRSYAQGRSDPDSAMGWERYLASMDLYAEFAAHWALNRLLQQERLGLAMERRRAEPPA